MPPRSVPDPRETALNRHPSAHLADSRSAGKPPARPLRRGRAPPTSRHPPHLFADPAAVKVRSALHLDGPMLCPPRRNRRTPGRRLRPERGSVFSLGRSCPPRAPSAPPQQKNMRGRPLDNTITPRTDAGGSKHREETMKPGRTLRELLEEVTRQSEGKRDYLAPSRALSVSTQASSHTTPRGWLRGRPRCLSTTSD